MRKKRGFYTLCYITVIYYSSLLIYGCFSVVIILKVTFVVELSSEIQISGV